MSNGFKQKSPKRSKDIHVALDDGNGLSYAYEYAWREHIPSGVYYYHIEAEKAGQKLKKAGKFAVLR